MGCYLGWNSISLSFSDVFQQNLVMKCIFYCSTVLYNFMNKICTRYTEMLTKVAWVTFCSLLTPETACYFVGVVRFVEGRTQRARREPLRTSLFAMFILIAYWRASSPSRERFSQHAIWRCKSDQHQHDVNEVQSSTSAAAAAASEVD